MTRRLALVVGDTAGHVNPALAIAETYRALFDDVDVFVLAAEGGPASQLVPASGYDLALVPALPLARTGTAGKMAALARVGPCLVRARQLLVARGSRLVIGTGGYASGGVLLAARTLRLRTAIVEPNVVPGLANRLLKHVAHRAYFTVPEAARGFPRQCAVLTGTPVSQSLAERLGAEQRTMRPGDSVRVLVTSGSRGDEFFASHVPPLLARVREKGVRLEVLHQGGTLDLGSIRDAYARLGLPASVEPRLDSLVDAYSWANFAIARAGACTLAELALAGLPALLVPLADAAADHQAANAKRFADAGAAIRTREDEWHVEHLATRLARILLDTACWHAMAQSAHQLADPEAATRIVHDCEEVMRGRW